MKIISMLIQLYVLISSVAMMTTPVTGSVTLFVNGSTRSLELPTAEYLEYQSPPSENDTGVMVVPIFTTGCQLLNNITTPLNRTDSRAAADWTALVPGYDIWTSGCNSYSQVAQVLLQQEYNLRAAGYPRLRALLLTSPLPAGAAGGPDDIYCGGAPLVAVPSDNPRSKEMAADVSIAGANQTCRRPPFMGADGGTVSLLVLTKSNSEQLQRWYFNRIRRQYSSLVRLQIHQEPGPWNTIFYSNGYKAVELTLFVLFMTLIAYAMLNLGRLAYTKQPFWSMRTCVLILDLLVIAVGKSGYWLPMVSYDRSLLFFAAEAIMKMEALLMLFVWVKRLPYAGKRTKLLFYTLLASTAVTTAVMIMWMSFKPSSYMERLISIMIVNTVTACLLIVLFSYYLLMFSKGRYTLGTNTEASFLLLRLMILAGLFTAYWMVAILVSWLKGATTDHPIGRLSITVIIDLMELLLHAGIIGLLSGPSQSMTATPKRLKDLEMTTDLELSFAFVGLNVMPRNAPAGDPFNPMAAYPAHLTRPAKTANPSSSRPRNEHQGGSASH